MSRRTEQIASLIRTAVQDVLSRGLNDPRVSGMITVTGVYVTEDLQEAKIKVSILPEEKQQLAFHGIASAAGWIRREIGEKIAQRKLPQLRFELDESFKKQAKVIEALAQAQQAAKPGGWGKKPGSAEDPTT